jgi:O-antigen/teichoic acid export membrane protein
MIGKIFRSYRPVVGLVCLRWFGALAGLGVNFILARSLDTEQLAAAWTTVSIAIVSTTVLTLGTDAASVRVISKRLAVGDVVQSRGFALFSLRLASVLGILWLVGCWAAALLIPFGEESVAQERLLFIGVVAPFIAVTRILSGQTLADGRPVQSNLPMLLLLPVLQLTAVYFVSVSTDALSLNFFLVIYLASILVVFLLQWRFAAPLHERISNQHPDFTRWRNWLMTGGFLVVPALLTDFSRDILSAFSVLLMGAQDVAILAIALKLTSFLRFGVVAINQIFAAKLAGAIAQDDQLEINRLLAVSTLLKLGPVAALAAIMSFFGAEIMSFFSPDLAMGGPVLALLTLETVALVIFGPSAPFMSLGKGHRVLPLFAIGSVVAMCALAFVLGPMYGAVGAAWAFCAAWGIWAASGTIYVWWTEGRDISIISAIRWAMSQRRG